MRLLISCLLTTLSATYASAQTFDDSVFIAKSVRITIDQYRKKFAGQEKFYNGSGYSEPPQTSDSHPFYLTDQLTFGTITFDGQDFEQVPLLYDLTTDQLVSESPASNLFVIAPHKLSSFTIGRSYFEKTDQVASLPRAGYYQVLYDGMTRLICLRQKTMQKSTANRILEINYYEKSRYFVHKFGIYHQVRNKASILRILSDKKTQVRTFIKANNLNFSKNKDAAFPEVLRHYDKLNLNVK